MYALNSPEETPMETVERLLKDREELRVSMLCARQRVRICDAGIKVAKLQVKLEAAKQEERNAVNLLNRLYVYGK